MTAHATERLLRADDWADYALLDSGAGWKLERLGGYAFARPEPQALWRPRTPLERWDPCARFAPAAEEAEEQGRWRMLRPVPEAWPCAWRGLAFHARCTPFRHLGVFPEQSVHWRWIEGLLEGLLGGRERPAEALNLFGYTGLASLVAARAGARVTHVDASKKALAFGKQNAALAGLGAAPVRWIADDALAFVERELRRGRRYDLIVLDPPKYGRGPNGEVWRLEEGLGPLLNACFRLLRHDPADPASARGALIATVYAVRLSHLALAQTGMDALEADHGEWEAGEMVLPHAGDDRLLPTAIYARWRG